MLTRLSQALLILLLLMFALPALAQTTTPPRYRIVGVTEGVSDDRCALVFEEQISNSGSAATTEASVELSVLSQPGVVLSRAAVPPLAAGENRIIRLTALLSTLTPGTQQTFQIRVLQNGVDAFDSAPRSVSLTVPELAESCRPADPSAMQFPVTIPLIAYTFDLANPTRDELLLGGGLLLVLLLVLLILLRLRRLLFGRAPAFGSYLPPYATTPPIDPYSQSGIRQSWQPYAQNNTITQPNVRGTNAVVKLLLGADGQYLNGWDITALRLSQYDQYGRVARTYTAGPLKVVRALNRLAHSRKPLDAEQLERKTAPLARQLVRQLMRKVTSRSAVLPVALDVRLRGHHGEVSIVFELYQSDGGQWHLLDRWQPEMTVTAKTIYESYTYTIHGQSGGESFKDFRQRLPLDMTRLLSELIVPRVRSATPTPEALKAAATPVHPLPPASPALPPDTQSESKG